MTSLASSVGRKVTEISYIIYNWNEWCPWLFIWLLLIYLSCFAFADTTHVSCNSLVIRKIHIYDKSCWKVSLSKYMHIKHKCSHILDRYVDMTRKHLDWVLKLSHTLLLMCSKPTKLALNCTCACSTSSRLVPWLVDWSFMLWSPVFQLLRMA